MFKAKKTLLLLFMLLVSITLVACDGGGGTATPTIAFGDAEITLEVGDDLTLSPTLTGIDSVSLVTFTTSKPDLISISGATITAIAAGNATVTATLSTNSAVSDTVIVRITSSTTNTLTALEVSSVDTFLGVGGSAMLTVTPTPSTASNAVTWSTSDSAVATVSAAGLVSAVSVGAATITATSSVTTSITGSI
ncbi:MAG: Ig-like domain-containing protein, partial [Bacilli bacterium]|nr:Ig-like domain-containing protein [Bacilli bacterium]